MVTGGLQPGVRRLRASAGPLWTVGLALLLLGLLYTHGAGTGDAAGHHGGAVAAPSATTHDIPVGHEGHEEQRDSAHQALECLSAQPQEDFALDAPGSAPVPDPGFRAPNGCTGAGSPVAAPGTAASGSPGTAAVLRI
ncbi:hypothetical protein [Streptomyces sp. NPDC048172]|uniref:hypothetical protein n=1 Tax=Streptomyces sp. NPDC048172 TaxID=3365505 RepID=UPI003719E0CA